MALTNFLVSSLITLEGFNEDKLYMESVPAPEVLNEPSAVQQIDGSFIEKTLDYVQSFDLIYQDIYTYTKPALYKVYTYNGNSYRAEELNPVANIFFENNLWDLAFVSANVFNYIMFNNNYLSFIYSVVLESAEIWAISTWQPTATREINVSAILYEHMF